MKKLRYNRVFKQGICAILFCIVLSSAMIIFSLVSKIQYDQLISNMESIEATIVDIDLEYHRKGPNVQKIGIEYVLNGITYNRDLGTDTAISHPAGRGAHYCVGDKIQIFYDPQNPEIIASPRSVKVGYFYLTVGLIFLIFVLFLLAWIMKRRRKFLVTQEEYDKEGEDIKKRKLEKKQQKKRAKHKRKNKRL
jgi:hypothetical protein